MAVKQIGKMREVVTFRVNNPTPKASRGQDDNYTDLLTTRGQFINDSNRRSLVFAQLDETVTARLIVRFQNAIETVMRSDLKIVISGATYTMQGRPKLIDQRKHLYEFTITADKN